MNKKFTYLFALLTLAFGVAKAQPGPGAVYPYLESFENQVAGPIEGQTGWMCGDFFCVDPSMIEVTAQRGMDSTQALSCFLNDNMTTDSIFSPVIGPLTANTLFGFSYRIVDPITNTAYSLESNGGSFKIELKSSLGQPILIYNCDSTNHIESDNYNRVEFSLANYAGNVANFRFTYYQGNSGNDFVVDIDSLVIMDDVLASISNNSQLQGFKALVFENNQIKIQTSLNTNCQATIYDMQGKSMFQANLNTSNAIDASIWSKGIYFVQLVKNGAAYNQKIVIH